MTSRQLSAKASGGANRAAVPPKHPSGRVPPGVVVRVSMLLRRRLLSWADRLLPSHLATAEHGHDFAKAHVFATMTRLGIADHLTPEPLQTSVLAQRVGCDPAALHRFLRAAADLGAVRMDRAGRVRATRTSRTLRSDNPFQVGRWCEYLASSAHQAAWADLAESVRTGVPAFGRVHGMSMFDHFALHPDEGADFSAGLGGLTLAEAGFIRAAYRFPRDGVVCDVAGGQGVLLAEILRNSPALKGVLIETPQVLAQARTYLSGLGVSDRVELVEGDLFRSVSATADLYILKWILHDWDDGTCISILKAISATMRPGARLLVIEGEQEVNVPTPRFSMIDLQMLVVTAGGRERSLEDYVALLESGGGLRVTSQTRTPTGLLLTEARPTTE